MYFTVGPSSVRKNLLPYGTHYVGRGTHGSIMKYPLSAIYWKEPPLPWRGLFRLTREPEWWRCVILKNLKSARKLVLWLMTALIKVSASQKKWSTTSESMKNQQTREKQLFTTVAAFWSVHQPDLSFSKMWENTDALFSTILCKWVKLIHIWHLRVKTCSAKNNTSNEHHDKKQRNHMLDFPCSCTWPTWQTRKMIRFCCLLPLKWNNNNWFWESVSCQWVVDSAACHFLHKPTSWEKWELWHIWMCIFSSQASTKCKWRERKTFAITNWCLTLDEQTEWTNRSKLNQKMQKRSCSDHSHHWWILTNCHALVFSLGKPHSTFVYC